MATASSSKIDAAAVDALLKEFDSDDDSHHDDEENKDIEAEDDEKPTSGKGSRGPYSGYNDAIRNAVTFLAEQPHLIMGAVELLTFFPNIMQWPDALFRLLRNEWRTTEIAKAQLYARDMYDKAEHHKRHGALRKQIKVAGNEKFSVNDFKLKHYRDTVKLPALQPFTAATTNYDITAWNPPHGRALNNEPPTLLQVSNGVINWPQGEDRGVFTKVMEWARDNNRLHLYTIRDVLAIANNPANGIGGQPSEAQTPDWDKEGWKRTKAIPKPW